MVLYFNPSLTKHFVTPFFILIVSGAESLGGAGDSSGACVVLSCFSSPSPPLLLHFF